MGGVGYSGCKHEVSTPSDHLKSIELESNRLRKYLPLSPASLRDRSEYNADMLKFMDARMMFRDFDGLFERFMKECRLQETGLTMGLQMKSRNTIIEPWPMRIKRSATQNEFDLLLASGHTGSERYVKWERVH